MKGMDDSEYNSCISNLGILEGEEIKLQYVCFRHTISPPSIWDGKQKTQTNKGLLVFTNLTWYLCNKKVHGNQTMLKR